MRRLLITVTVAACLALSSSWAATPVDGQVTAPTFGSPALARIGNAQLPNGTFGWVFPVTSAMHTFRLGTVDGATGLEDFDVFFYASLDDTADQPLASFANPADEAGDVPAGAHWAIVTLSAGLNGTFRFTF